MFRLGDLLTKLIRKTAVVGGGYASGWGLYQAKEPKELAKYLKNREFI